MTDSKRIIAEALNLPAEDRLEVIEQLWDSLSEDAEALPVTDEEKQLIDERLAERDANPNALVPWVQVQKNLRRSQ